jgi:hypothetical protein
VSLWKRIVRGIVRAKCPDCDGRGYHVLYSDIGSPVILCKLCRGKGRV